MAEKAVNLWRRFEELAPWYVNGTISHEDRRWVDEFILTDRAAAARLKWESSLQTRLREAAPPIAAEAGFERLLGRIRAERAPVSTPRVSLIQRLRDTVLSLSQRPAFALAAMAVVILQTGVIGALVNQSHEQSSEYAMTRSLSTAAPIDSLLRVSFRSDTTEASLRLLLVEVGGAIVGGPGQLGVYLVQVPAARFELATAKLKASPLVTAADVVPPMPAQP